jgi:hypothetical protein
LPFEVALALDPSPCTRVYRLLVNSGRRRRNDWGAPCRPVFLTQWGKPGNRRGLFLAVGGGVFRGLLPKRHALAAHLNKPGNLSLRDGADLRFLPRQVAEISVENGAVRDCGKIPSIMAGSGRGDRGVLHCGCSSIRDTHGHTGSRTLALNPPSGESDSMMSPPCDRAISREMARPRPDPP